MVAGGELVKPTDLAHGHVFSVTAQPHLQQLFRLVADDLSPLALVVGAGVSVNAGLPTWDRLVENLVECLDDPEDPAGVIKEMAKQFPGSVQRKAELIIQLAQNVNKNVQDHELVRDALYPRQSPAAPGALAKAVARLVAVRKQPTYIVTTNFDLLLEKALEQLFPVNRIRSFGLLEVAAWRAWCSDPANVGVLHVHGILRQGGAATLPLTLTESQFLANGREVQAAIKETLDEYPGLFIGLSVTDPNVVGPLYARAATGGGPELFAVDVVKLDRDEAKRLREAEFAVASVRFLHDPLGLKPILLKSYSQMEQVVSDLALSVREPVRYRSRRARDTLNYGRRSQAAILACYTAIGAQRAPFVPVGDDAAGLTRRLRSCLGPTTELGKCLKRWTVDHDVHLPNGLLEHWGLNLWLRRLDVPGAERTYSLRLVGASAFSAHDPWFLDRNVPIVRETRYAAAQAVYAGNIVKTNLGAQANSDVWRGVVAVPIALTGMRSREKVGDELLDRVVVGAITLDSDLYVDDQGLDPQNATEWCRRGVIARLRGDEQADLRAALDAAAVQVLSPPRRSA